MALVLCRPCLGFDVEIGLGINMNISVMLVALYQKVTVHKISYSMHFSYKRVQMPKIVTSFRLAVVFMNVTS